MIVWCNFYRSIAFITVKNRNAVSYTHLYYTQRKAGAYSQKGKISNLKEMNETFNYLRANGIYNLEDLESRVNEHNSTTELSLIHI